MEIKRLNDQNIDEFVDLIRVFEDVFVQEDKVDDYAIDFYRSTPITAEEQVVHFYYSLDKK